MAGIGALLTAGGLGLAATLGETSGLGAVVAVLAVVGIGIGIFSTPSTVVVMSAVDETRYGIASAITGQSRTLGMMVCMAAVTMVIAACVGDRPLGPDVFGQYTRAMRTLFAGGGILGFFGAALAFGAGDRRPPASRAGRRSSKPRRTP
jgi:MFS family permease